MNWNALEWDRAAEELTWERVTLHDITDLQTPPSLVHHSQNSLRGFSICAHTSTHMKHFKSFRFPF